MKKFFCGLVILSSLAVAQAAELECLTVVAGPETDFSYQKTVLTAPVVDNKADLELITTKSGRIISATYYNSPYFDDHLHIIARAKIDTLIVSGHDSAELSFNGSGDAEQLVEIKCAVKNN